MTTKQKLLSFNNQKSEVFSLRQDCSSLYLLHFTTSGGLLSVKLNKKQTKNCSNFCHPRLSGAKQKNNRLLNGCWSMLI